MQKEKENNSDFAGREISVTRLLNAPVALVWEVWTKPEHIKNWWGPNGFTNTMELMDVTSGGQWQFIMHGPDGTNYPNKSIYKEVIKHERIVFEHKAPNFTATINFIAQGNKTLLKWHMLFETKELFEMVVRNHKADKGLEQNVEKLEAYLIDKTEDGCLSISRVFNAPRNIVFKACSESGQLAQWWGPAGFEMRDTKLDFRPGGMFHYGMQSPDGHVMWGRFVYREISAPEKIVFVNSFSDKDGNVTRAPFNPDWPLEILNILTLTESDGKTTLTLKGRPVNATEIEQKTFDEMRQGMQQGFGGTFDQLETFLSKLNLK